MLPSDLLRVDDMLYLHVIVNRGFPHVIWTEIWSSADNGITWEHLGEAAKFPADLYDGHAQLWSWDYEPDDGMSTAGWLNSTAATCYPVPTPMFVGVADWLCRNGIRIAAGRIG